MDEHFKAGDTVYVKYTNIPMIVKDIYELSITCIQQINETV